MPVERLDSGWCKSKWALFWWLPFFVFFLAIGVLASVDVIVNGFRGPWFKQVIPLVLVVGLAFVLGCGLIRAFARYVVEFSEQGIIVWTQFLWNRKTTTIGADSIAWFFAPASSDVFDLFIVTRDNQKIPVAKCLGIRKMEQWCLAASRLAPVKSEPPSD